MAIDVAHLRKLLASGTLLPWHVHRDQNPGIGADCTKYNIGGFEFDSDDDLAVAAVNALPELLEVFETACAYADSFKHTRDPLQGTATLFRAIDNACGRKEE